MDAVGKRGGRGLPVGTPALLALTKAGITHAVHPYAHDARSGLGYGPEAAASLGVESARVFKTLIAVVDGRLTVAVVPVPNHLDLRALARACGAKRALMAEPAIAERATGYVLGGISPLGQRQRLTTVVDSSAAAQPTIFVSAGRRGVDIELAASDLLLLTAGHLAPISR